MSRRVINRSDAIVAAADDFFSFDDHRAEWPAGSAAHVVDDAEIHRVGAERGEVPAVHRCEVFAGDATVQLARRSTALELQDRVEQPARAGKAA